MEPENGERSCHFKKQSVIMRKSHEKARPDVQPFPVAAIAGRGRLLSRRRSVDPAGRKPEEKSSVRP
jgi:hypothetical protein